jgi:hypothetical protein
MTKKVHDRSTWTRGGAGPRHIRGRNYKNLIEFTRPCKTCGVNFSVYVTEKIADGGGDSNVFGLRNCEIHRGSNGDLHLVAQRGKEKMMAEELKGMYSIEQELRNRIDQLRHENAMLEAKINSRKMPWEA